MKEEELKKLFKKSQLFGSNSFGSQFDDIDTCCKEGLLKPTSISTRRGVIMDNLTFGYQGYSAAHGGMGGTLIETKLDEDEHIIKVAGTYGNFNYQDLIDKLVFTTNKRVIQANGQSSTDKKDFEYIAEKGHFICALFGCAGYYLNSIGFYTIKLDFKIPEIDIAEIELGQEGPLNIKWK